VGLSPAGPPIHFSFIKGGTCFFLLKWSIASVSTSRDIEYSNYYNYGPVKGTYTSKMRWEGTGERSIIRAQFNS
jgi:hypothetical protein